MLLLNLTLAAIFVRVYVCLCFYFWIFLFSDAGGQSSQRRVLAVESHVGPFFCVHVQRRSMCVFFYYLFIHFYFLFSDAGGQGSQRRPVLGDAAEGGHGGRGGGQTVQTGWELSPTLLQVCVCMIHSAYDGCFGIWLRVTLVIFIFTCDEWMVSTKRSSAFYIRTAVANNTIELGEMMFEVTLAVYV